MPMTWLRPGGWRTSSVATIAAKIGVPPFSRPVTDELMCCSASGNNVKGMATHKHRQRCHPRPDRRRRDARANRGTRLSASAPEPDAHEGDQAGFQGIEADVDEQERRAPDAGDGAGRAPSRPG